MEKTKKRPAKKIVSTVKEAVVKAVKGAARAATSSAPKKISKDQLFGLIQSKAYELYVMRGCLPGNNLEDWYTAEALVKKELGLK